MKINNHFLQSLCVYIGKLGVIGFMFLAFACDSQTKTESTSDSSSPTDSLTLGDTSLIDTTQKMVEPLAEPTPDITEKVAEPVAPKITKKQATKVAEEAKEANPEPKAVEPTALPVPPPPPGPVVVAPTVSKEVKAVADPKGKKGKVVEEAKPKNKKKIKNDEDVEVDN